MALKSLGNAADRLSLADLASPQLLLAMGPKPLLCLQSAPLPWGSTAASAVGFSLCSDPHPLS